MSTNDDTPLPTTAEQLRERIIAIAPSATVTLVKRPRDGGRDEELKVAIGTADLRIDWQCEGYEEDGSPACWVAYLASELWDLALEGEADLRQLLERVAAGE